MWVRPHESHTPGTSSGCSSQLRQFTRVANSACGRDRVNSDGKFLELNACCTLSIIQVTKWVVNHKKKKKCIGKQVTVVALPTELFFSCRSTFTLKSLPLGPGRIGRRALYNPWGSSRSSVSYTMRANNMRWEKADQMPPQLKKSLSPLDEGILERLQFWGKLGIIFLKIAVFFKLCLSEISQRFWSLE